jgi:hypothetical protein
MSDDISPLRIMGDIAGAQLGDCGNSLLAERDVAIRQTPCMCLHMKLLYRSLPMSIHHCQTFIKCDACSSILYMCLPSLILGF